MHIINDTSSLRILVLSARQAGQKIAFVPTMGNLHEGHLSLIDEAKKQADLIIASIFVNPMQFGANEDLDAYPRTFKADSEVLSQRGCNILFAPTVKEVYPNGMQAETKVDVPSLGKYHCGASREGHFIGVSTVVAKLFNMVQTDVAIFGQKDFQQLAVIRKMTKDLCFPIEIIGVPTSREASGLARSSRNSYLNTEEKKSSVALFKVLCECKETLQKGGIDDISHLKSKALATLKEHGFTPDYFNFANPHTLEKSQISDTEIVILAAAYMGTTRLIDNITVSL